MNLFVTQPMTLSALCSILVLAGFSRFLNEAYLIIFPPNQLWYCKYYMTIFMTASFCSTLFIISMTFDRFYSIIRPHKAASFNTIKRAKVTIFCIGLFSVIYNIPHIYLTLAPEGRCTSYLNPSIFGKIYYWISISFNIVVPFTSLLTMNGFIILALAERSKLLSIDSENQVQGHNQSQGQGGRMSSSEKQIYITLLLVTFSFLIFMAPSWFSIIYYMFVDYKKSPRSIAGFYLSHSIMQKAYYTNYSINFILYVISGQKFRSDLVRLFICKRLKSNRGLKLSSNESETQISSVKSEEQTICLYNSYSVCKHTCPQIVCTQPILQGSHNMLIYPPFKTPCRKITQF